MSRYIDPKSLDGLPLVTHAIGHDVYSVNIAGLQCGRITANLVAGGDVVWHWTITAPYLPEDLQPSHGNAATLYEAKAAFREKFDKWLEWAKEPWR
jgi:hypothetical protein